MRIKVAITFTTKSLLILFLSLAAYGCSKPNLHKEFNLIPAREPTIESCFDLDKGINTKSIEVDICFFQGPHSNSPVYLVVINGATKYLLDKSMSIEDCKDYLSDFSSTNIPDFPDWKICIQTNANHLALLEYKNDAFYFITE